MMLQTNRNLIGSLSLAGKGARNSLVSKKYLHAVYDILALVVDSRFLSESANQEVVEHCTYLATT